jgi:hypothetical protein
LAPKEVVRVCTGFRMPAMSELGKCRWAGVRKPSRNEPAVGGRRRFGALDYGDYMSAGTVKPDFSALFTFIHSFVRPEEPILSSRP